MSFWERLLNAFRVFWSMLTRGSIPPDLVREVAVPPAAAAAPPPAVPEDEGDRAVQLLALLQRDGRLVDFLREDLAGYADAQIGAAVRDVHDKCRSTLERYFTLEPVTLEDEGRPFSITPSTDPVSVKVVGQVPAGGTARGVVRHRGWRVTRLALPPLPAADARRVVGLAEVEVP
jgi:hypothetical protein